MKNTFFNQLNKNPGHLCNVQLPNYFDSVMDLIKENSLKLYYIDVGLDKIEVFTDPHRHTYIECSVYRKKEEYEKKKIQYQEYLRKCAEDVQIHSNGLAVSGELRNGLQATLCIDDKKQMLLWETERTHVAGIDLKVLINAVKSDDKEHLVFDKNQDEIIKSEDGFEKDSQSRLRFDGFYVLEKKETAEYLRFFPSGKVVGLLFDKNRGQFLKDRLDEEYEENGSYSLIKNRIVFEIIFLDGNLPVDYEGIVENNKLTLFRKIKHSSYPRQLGVYRFTALDFEKQGEKQNV
jgi:hypothetical protein